MPQETNYTPNIFSVTLHLRSEGALSADDGYGARPSAHLREHAHG